MSSCCGSPKPSPGSKAAGSGASSARKTVQWTVFSEMGPAGPWEVDFPENACIVPRRQALGLAGFAEGEIATAQIKDLRRGTAERRMRSSSRKKPRKSSLPQGDRPHPTSLTAASCLLGHLPLNRSLWSLGKALSCRVSARQINIYLSLAQKIVSKCRRGRREF